jgi:DNA anti-recombination protein RmuC
VQKGIALEGEFARKMEKVFAEVMDAHFREFENRLAGVGREHLTALNKMMEQETEPLRQKSMAQLRELSEQTAKSVQETIQKGLESAAGMLKDWTAKAAQQLEGTARESAESSQQQIVAYLQAALGELHHGAKLQMRDLRERLHQAALALEGPGLGAERPMPPEPKAASPRGSTPASNPKVDVVSERTR